MRGATNKLFDLMESGVISADSIAIMALQYMSDDDVAKMARANDLDLDLGLEDDERIFA